MIRKKLRRAVPAGLFAILLATLGLTAVQPAAADSYPPQGPFSGWCPDFDVTISGTNGDQKVKEGPKHTIIGGNGYILTLTASVTTSAGTTVGKTIKVPTNGSVTHITKNSDGTTTFELTGQNVLIFFSTDKPAGPSMTLYTGRVVFKNDANNNSTLISSSGRQRDLCAELAS